MERRTRLDYANMTGRLRDYSQPSVRRAAVAKRFGTEGVIISRSSLQQKSPSLQQYTVVQRSSTKKIIKKHPSAPRTKPSSVLKRHPLRTPRITVPKTASRIQLSRRRRHIKSVLVATMASVVFVSGIYASWHTWRTNKEVVAQVQSAQIDTEIGPPGVLTDNEMPDEADVTDSAYDQYHVAQSLPRYITIESIGVQGRVRRMGLTKDGAVQTPSSIYDAGWYESSAKPGEPNGATLIDGHVYGPTKPAIFSKLRDIKMGDVIDIERGDGLHVKYEVVASDIYDRRDTDMSKALRSYDTTKPGLNIITCHGKYDRTAQTYAQRLVVYAVAL